MTFVVAALIRSWRDKMPAPVATPVGPDLEAHALSLVLADENRKWRADLPDVFAAVDAMIAGRSTCHTCGTPIRKDARRLYCSERCSMDAANGRKRAERAR